MFRCLLSQTLCVSRVKSTGQTTRVFHQSCQRCQRSQLSAIRDRRDRGYLLLVIPAATFCLGTWQVQRRKWKLGLITELGDHTTAPPVVFPLDTEELNDLEYRKVVLQGEFDHQREFYIMPRVPVDDDSHGGLMTAKGSKSGANIITAFKVADRDLTILINRGWVPRDKINPATRLQGQIEGELELVGVVRKTEARKPFAAKNDVGRNRWFHRDVETMAEIAGTDPIFLDAVVGSTVPGGPVGGQTRVTLRNEHLSYIFTWYSLSAITTFMWYSRYWR